MEQKKPGKIPTTELDLLYRHSFFAPFVLGSHFIRSQNLTARPEKKDLLIMVTEARE